MLFLKNTDSAIVYSFVNFLWERKYGTWAKNNEQGSTVYLFHFSVCDSIINGDLCDTLRNPATPLLFVI